MATKTDEGITLKQEGDGRWRASRDGVDAWGANPDAAKAGLTKKEEDASYDFGADYDESDHYDKNDG